MTPKDNNTQALEAAGFWGKATQIRPIKQRENAVYEVASPKVGRAALRIHRSGYQSEAAIWSELWWMGALAEKGLPVPRPLATSEGSMIAHLQDGRIASMLSWVDGHELGQGGARLSGTAKDQMHYYASLGALLAKVHAVTDRLTLPPTFQRPKWDMDGLVGPSPFWGRFWEHPVATAGEQALMQTARGAAAERLADYAAQGADQGLIHADVLRENVLMDGQRATLIDFDDCGFGFRLYDLGTALSQNLYEPHLPHIVQGLADGYGRLSEADHHMLPWFTLLRCLASVGWTMPRLAPNDPQHRIYINRAIRVAEIVLNDGDLFGQPLSND